MSSILTHAIYWMYWFVLKDPKKTSLLETDKYHIIQIATVLGEPFSNGVNALNKQYRGSLVYKPPRILPTVESFEKSVTLWDWTAFKSKVSVAPWSMLLDGHYWSYYPGVLREDQVISTHLKIGYSIFKWVVVAW